MAKQAPVVKPTAIVLDPDTTDAGAMERLFLLEATTPGMAHYTAVENLRAMRLMRQTIENRLASPADTARAVQPRRPISSILVVNLQDSGTIRTSMPTWPITSNCFFASPMIPLIDGMNHMLGSFGTL